MKAKIENVKLMSIDKVWKKHKPQGLGFSDNDVIVIELRTENGEIFTQSFYCRLKADGTLGHSITKRSEKRQRELQIFIKKYITQEQNYNIRSNIKGWKGKEVGVERIDGGHRVEL